MKITSTFSSALRTTTLGAAILLGSQFLSGCGINDSLNNSPNNILESKLQSVAGVKGLLVGLQTFTGDYYSADRSRLASMWSWQMCAPPGLGRAQPTSWNNYIVDLSGPTNDSWLYGYKTVRIANDILRFAPKVDFDTVPEKNAAIRSTIIGIAETYKALVLGELAADFGSVPINIPSDVSPAQFASQAEAFAEVQRLLSDALTKVTTANIPEDLNFGGDGELWKPVIHSLKARYYLDATDYPNALAEANLGIADPSVNLMAFYSQEAREHSPWGYWVIDEGTLRPEKTFIDALKSEPNDNRLSKYFTSNDSGRYWGFAIHGETVANPAEKDASLVASLKMYSSYSDNFPLMRYAENVLIRAEAALRAGDAATATTQLDIIRTSAGLTPFAGVGNDTLLSEILKQKWLELFLEGQAYNDQRRTKTMFEPVPRSGQITGNFRFIYPISELNANPNVPAQTDDLAKPLLGY